MTRGSVCLSWPKQDVEASRRVRRRGVAILGCNIVWLWWFGSFSSKKFRCRQSVKLASCRTTADAANAFLVARATVFSRHATLHRRAAASATYHKPVRTPLGRTNRFRCCELRRINEVEAYRTPLRSLTLGSWTFLKLISKTINFNQRTFGDASHLNIHSNAYPLKSLTMQSQVSFTTCQTSTYLPKRHTSKSNHC